MKTAGQAKTLGEVRDQLCGIAAEVMGDRRMCAQVHEGVNALGKVVGSCKVHLDYCKLAGSKPTGDWGKFMSED